MNNKLKCKPIKVKVGCEKKDLGVDLRPYVINAGKIDEIKVNGVVQEIINKSVNILVPTDHDIKELINEKAGHSVKLIVNEEEGEYTITPKVYNKNGGELSSSDPITIKRSYVHNQNVASTVWSINHKLNKHPSVTLIEDRYGNTIIGEVSYVDNNNIEISFSAEVAGKAFLN